MKKFLCLFLAAAFAFAAVSCSSDGGSDNDDSIYSLINDGGLTVDLTGKKIKEDVSVDSSVTIKNADFGGNTLTVNAANVVLENVKNVKIVVSDSVKSSFFTIKSSNGDVSVVVKGGSSIVIEGSTITSVSIEGTGASVKVSDKAKVDSVEVKAEDTTIKGGENSSVGTVSVGEGVKTVDVADGKIENVKAGEDVVINVSGDSKIDKVDGGKFVVEDEKVALPEDAKKIEISSVTFKPASPKTEYEIGDKFDYSGLSVSVKYSDETETEISLNANNVEISGFNSSAVGNCEVSFVYKGFDVEGTLSVTIKASSKPYKNLLNEGIDLLFDQKYDEGVAKIKEAYNKEQNDETKLYYALAEIATISTDSSVSNIMKKNFGVKNYPSTLNALINGEWLKDYKEGYYKDVYTLEEMSEGGAYVKVSGDGCDWNSDGEKCYIAVLLDEDNEWISCYEHDFNYVKNVKLDENGKYLVSVRNLPETVKDEITDTTKKYDYSYDHEKLFLSDDYSIKFPDFNVPEWLKNSDRYKKYLVKSTQTSGTATLLLLGNLVECNPNGANELIDNILKIFDGKFENAKKLAASISEGNVLVPSKVISALCLEDVLGDSSVYVGKAELNVLISSMQILKGAFQWISSYDLSANVSSAKDFFGENPAEWEFFRKLAKTKSLRVRNDGAMETSKKTFIEAIEILENSYNYLVGSASSYPQAAKDEVARYGNVILAAAENLNECLEKGSVFYIPNENPFETLNWNASSSSNSFGIDMGKLFTAGYFSGIFERDGSDLKIECVVDYHYHKESVEGCIEGTFNIEFTSNMKTSDDVYEAVEKELEKLIGDDYSWMEYDARIGLEINSKLLEDLFPGSDFEGVSIIPMAGFGGYSSNY